MRRSEKGATMRHTPTYLAALLLAIQIARVARFASGPMRAGALGAVFAVAIAAGVFVAAYWTRQSAARGETEDRRSIEARRWAMLTLALFVLVDGGLNLADVLATAWPDTLPLQIAAVVYGAFPTLASALLAALQGRVDRLPHVSKPGLLAALQKRLLAKLEAPEAEAEQTAAAQIAPPSVNGYHEFAKCTEPGCTWQSKRRFDTHDPADVVLMHRTLSGHMKAHAKKEEVRG